MTALARLRAPRALATIAIAAAAIQLAVLVVVLASRLTCPMDIEYLESAHVYHAWRIAHALPIYGPPTATFVAFPYPPLYWLVTAGAAQIFGWTDAAGRAVSVASLIAVAVILARLAFRAAPARALGAAFAALAIAGICAGFRFADGSYDWARSDMFATALVIIAAALVGDGRVSIPRSAAAAVVIAASIYTKQSGAIFACWIVVFVFARDRWGGVRLAAMTGALCVVPLVLLQSASDGWFVKWMLYPGHQPLKSFAAPVLSLLGQLPHAPFLLAFPFAAVALYRRRWLQPRTVLWLGMFAVAIAGATLAMLKEFCVNNIWIPELVLAWPVALMLVGDWLRGRGDARGVAPIIASASLLACGLGYDPRPYLPASSKWDTAVELDALVRGLDGGVVVTTVPMAAVDAGDLHPQPILSTYEDARSGGMPTDYAAALRDSGARWVITTGRYARTDRAPELHMAPTFERVRALAIDFGTLSDWDRTPATPILWQRVAR